MNFNANASVAGHDGGLAGGGVRPDLQNRRDPTRAPPGRFVPYLRARWSRAESVQVVSRAGSSAGSYPHALK